MKYLVLVNCPKLIKSGNDKYGFYESVERAKENMKELEFSNYKIIDCSKRNCPIVFEI